MSDFFISHSGTLPVPSKRQARLSPVKDKWFDLAIQMSPNRIDAERRAASQAPRNVLIAGIEVPKRASDIHDVIDRLEKDSRHSIQRSVVRMQDHGKFFNIDAAISAAAQPLAAFDWLVVTDDDIAFGHHFLDRLIAFAEAADVAIAQPAHAFDSYTTYTITQRRWASLMRETTFVEIGPLTLIRRDACARLVPFPESRWCYGIDLVWTEIAERNGFRMGISDGTPIRHLRPVAASYDMDVARLEGEALLERYGIRRSRAEIFERDVVRLGCW